MKTNALFLTGAASGALMLCTLGCNSMNTIENAQPVAQRQMISDKRMITDPWLHDRVQPIGINTATGPGGFLKIQVEVLNTTSHRTSFTYRIEWFDENGMIVNLPTGAAIPRSLEGGETASITATAPTDRAKDFRIKLQEPVN